MKIPRSPAGLQKNGKRFWRKVLNDFELIEAHDLERFFLACRCLDDIAEAESCITKEGRFVKDRFDQLRENVAAKSIRDNKALFCRIIRELALDLDIPDSRPPRRY